MKAAARSLNTTLARRLMALFGLVVGLALLCQAGLAQAQPDDDPPARVARVGEVIGDAWLYDAESQEWTRVTRNQTLGEGDRLRTDDRARVALRSGSTSLWLDERSDMVFSKLDEGSMLLKLDKGDLGLRLRASDAAAETRVRTREGELIPEREGLYRVEQLENDRGSRALVWQGKLRFEPARGGDIPPTWLQNGEEAEFWWAGGPRVERQRLNQDSFGEWMVAENQRDGDATIAQRYVSPEMTGIEDLDRNGRWEQSPEHGALWYPIAVGSDWAPYRDGRWVWTRNWGWSWVDDAPWGFAPFHYGRWVQWRGRWCWAPGGYVRRPVYAPALVAWVGGGSFGVSIGIGGRTAPPRYGWYPLAPREAYVPPYRHSPVYVRRVNGDRDHGPQRGRHHEGNRNVPGAISYLPGQGGPVRALPPGEVRHVKPLPTPGAAPGRGDLVTVVPQQRPGPGTRAPSDMLWRSENNHGNWRGQDRGERHGRDGRDGRDGREGRPERPLPPAQTVPHAAPTQPEAPWRGRDRDRDDARPAAPSQEQRAQEQLRQQQRQAQEHQQQQEAQQRAEEQRRVRISPIERQAPQAPQSPELRYPLPQERQAERQRAAEPRQPAPESRPAAPQQAQPAPQQPAPQRRSTDEKEKGENRRANRPGGPAQQER